MKIKKKRSFLNLSSFIHFTCVRACVFTHREESGELKRLKGGVVYLYTTPLHMCIGQQTIPAVMIDFSYAISIFFSFSYTCALVNETRNQSRAILFQFSFFISPQILSFQT